MEFLYTDWSFQDDEFEHFSSLADLPAFRTNTTTYDNMGLGTGLTDMQEDTHVDNFNYSFKNFSEYSFSDEEDDLFEGILAQRAPPTIKLENLHNSPPQQPFSKIRKTAAFSTSPQFPPKKQHKQDFKEKFNNNNAQSKQQYNNLPTSFDPMVNLLKTVKLDTSEKPVQLIVCRQPPEEVRTRTPSENRTFSCVVKVQGNYEQVGLESIQVKLAYGSPSTVDVKQQILGGEKVVRIQKDARCVFDNLSIREASTKHGEKEFCLEFIPLTRDGRPLGNFGVKTTSFYTYSHMKVLTRRRNVNIRALKKEVGLMQGGENQHVIGQPFIQGPSLRVVFRTPHGDVEAPALERFSDSVLFFKIPPYPNLSSVLSQCQGKNLEIKVQVIVTNDGRSFSNALPFTYTLAY
eukprot:CAMPEP_0174264342 /NCGR_PEP_ID=MMETSP0439-20130205/22212_1 /TAXON_ID=0 /ORGANISM="Stereomyxa ramosa, Strain Chinc5" /LENGTH=403 /DNA_ID=CAMNT_0015350173 /DNA_START=47 /DNA_END=1258 /DNA_ORIENTATION=-